MPNDERGISETARAWVLPQGSTGLFSAHRDAHRARVTERFGAQPAGPGHGAADIIRAAIVADPNLLGRLPGDGGLDLAADPDYAGSEPVRRGLDILAAELAVRGGEAFECRLGPSDLLLLPLSGLALPLRSGLPVTLSAGGDRLVVADGSQRHVLHGGDGGLLECRDPDVVRRVSVEGVTIEQHWDLLSAPVERFPDATIVEPPPLGTEHVLTLRRAFRLLDRVDPAMADEFREFPTRYVPLRNQPGLTRHSVSIRQLPGVLWSNMTDPFEVLDLVVHEFSHGKMCMLEDEGPLMARPATRTLAPWRGDLRTAQGLFHGIYAFFEVARVFDLLYQQWEASERGETRVALLRTCVEEGIRLQDECDPGLDPLGRSIMSMVAAENADALDKLAVTAPARLASARATVRAHLAQAGRPDSTGPTFLA